MFKFLILICLFFSSVKSVPKKPSDSFEEALEFEKSQYDFDATYKVDLDQFESFKFKYNKKYKSDEEEQKRFSIFRSNLIKIKLLNFREKGSAVYGINSFVDLDENEFRKHYTGLRMDKKKIEESVGFSEPEFDRNAKLPKEIDWRKKGAVTEVKDQKLCGSCWAFSAIGAIEGQNKIVNNELISLSEEEIVDCDTQSFGCDGGWMSTAFESVMKMGGVETEKDYPYLGLQSECKFKKSLSVVQVEKYVNLTQNEDDIANYVAQKGPVSIALNANYMQFYQSGISDPGAACNPVLLNHGLLIVGYGEDQETGLKFWIIKNSWDESWGDKGYYYLVRGKNACGVQELASLPIVKKKDNKKVFIN